MEKLPDELGLGILSFLSRTDLLNVSLVSRWHRRLATDDAVYGKVCQPLFEKLGSALFAYNPPSRDYYNWHIKHIWLNENYLERYSYLFDDDREFHEVLLAGAQLCPALTKMSRFVTSIDPSTYLSTAAVVLTRQFYNMYTSFVTKGRCSLPSTTQYPGWDPPLASNLSLDLFLSTSIICGVGALHKNECVLKQELDRLTSEVAPSNHELKVQTIAKWFVKTYGGVTEPLGNNFKLISLQDQMGPGDNTNRWGRSCYFSILCRRLGVDVVPSTTQNMLVIVATENGQKYHVMLSDGTAETEEEFDQKVAERSPHIMFSLDQMSLGEVLRTFAGYFECLRNYGSPKASSDRFSELLNEVIKFTGVHVLRAFGTQFPVVPMYLGEQRFLAELQSLRSGKYRFSKDPKTNEMLLKVFFSTCIGFENVFLKS